MASITQFLNLNPPTFTLAVGRNQTVHVLVSDPQAFMNSAGGHGMALSVVSGALPAGMALNTAIVFNGGNFNGTPTAAGIYTFTLQLNYDYAGSSAAIFAGTIFVDPAGHVQKCTTAGTGGSSAPVWNSTGGSTTDGTAIWHDEGLLVGGLPQQTFTVEVLPAPLTTSFSFSDANWGVLGQSYWNYFQAVGGASASYTWALASGALPPGLYLATYATGTPDQIFLSGTPTQAGTYQFILVATGNLGDVISQTVVLCIAPAQVGDGNFMSIPPAFAGVPYSFQLTQDFAAFCLSFNAQPGPATMVLNSPPAWMSMTPGGLITGTPPFVGNPQHYTRLDNLVLFTDALGHSTPPASSIAMVWLDAAPTSTSCHCISAPVLPTVPGWLVINEPVGGFTDQSARLFFGEGHQNGFSQQLRQRGQATVHLTIARGDTYEPVRGSPLFLYDRTPTLGYTLVFAGLIQDLENLWTGTAGEHYVVLTAVSFEAVLDTVYAPPYEYKDQTAGFIVADLLCRLECGSPVAAGTIQSGPIIPLLNTNYEKLSDLFDQLATTAGFIWGVDPVTQLLFFRLPLVTAAPFVLADVAVGWESLDWKELGADYRNRQAIRLSFDAFAHSCEFFIGAGQKTITLARPVNQVTNAWATLSTPNTATAIFTGVPDVGDTVTVKVPVGPGFGWQSGIIYGANGVIVVDGFLQKITTASGVVTTGGPPTFSTVTGENTIDSAGNIWTNQGPAGLATGDQTYTFVDVLDNTQFGQVVRGASAAEAAQNLADAFNATAAYPSIAPTAGRGLTFSLPTWENSLCNAVDVTGTGFTLQQKHAGTGWIASLASASANFSWSDSVTSGGTSPNGSLGPGEGATIELKVYVEGTDVAAPGLSYVPGSNILTMATPLNAGSNLNVEYTRAGGDVIEVEDTALVAALAAITHGTGKVQQISDASTTGLVTTSAAAGLQFAQEALEAYKVVPTSLDYKTYRPGLQVGQALILAFAFPTGATTLLNGTWLIEEISAELIACGPWLGTLATGVEGGHYLYTVKLIDIAQIADFLDFWEGLAGGGGGGGGVATSGGGLTVPPPAEFPQHFDRRTNSGQTFTGGDDGAFDLADFLDSTNVGCTFTGRFQCAIFKNGTYTNATFTGDFRGCDFSNSDLTGVTFDGNFSGCDFSNTTMVGTIGAGSLFIGAVFTSTVVKSGLDFHGADLAGSCWKNATTNTSNFKGCNFAGVAFINTSLQFCDFTGVPGTTDTLLNGCAFVNSDLSGATFTGANLAGAAFFDCSTNGTDPDPVFTGANLTGALFQAPAGFVGAGIGLGAGSGPVSVQAANYTALPWDVNKLLSFSAGDLTLPAAAVSSTWQLAVQNTAGAPMAINTSGLTIDGAAGPLALGVGLGLRIFSDGTNYFTLR